MTPLRSLILPAALVLLPGQPGAGNQVGKQPEYLVKARYLVTLAEYATWPPRPGADRGRPFVVGVLGTSPFENYLSDLCANHPIRGRQAQVHYLRNIRNLENCDILFICESESDRLFEIVRAVRGKGVLTISDSADFASRGVMVNLFVNRDRVGFEVNLGAVRASGFEISSHVLKLAKVVE